MSFPFPVATGKKKTVQVFECPQETWKQRKPTARKAKGGDEGKEAAALSLKEEIRKEFDETFASVKEFASAGLKGKEKKAHDAQRIEALGGKAAANRRMPYNMLLGLKKAAAKREARDREVSKQADVITGKRKTTRGGLKPTEKTRKKVDYGVQATKGRFKRGVLDVSRL